MSSFVLPWVEIKSYVRSVGPKVGRPYRPSRCELCGHHRVWFNGWRLVYPAVMQDGRVLRFGDGLPLQRVKCASCKKSWTMLPAFLTSQRTYAADVDEFAGLAYLLEAYGTYRGVGRAIGCAHSAVWMWVGWLARLETPASLVAEATRFDSTSPAVHEIPRMVPQAHPKARSTKRERALLRALQMLVALACLARAQPVAPLDPSPLRARLVDRFLGFPPVTLRGAPTGSPQGERLIRVRDG